MPAGLALRLNTADNGLAWVEMSLAQFGAAAFEIRRVEVIDRGPVRKGKKE